MSYALTSEPKFLEWGHQPNGRMGPAIYYKVKNVTPLEDGKFIYSVACQGWIGEGPLDVVVRAEYGNRQFTSTREFKVGDEIKVAK